MNLRKLIALGGAGAAVLAPAAVLATAAGAAPAGATGAAPAAARGTKVTVRVEGVKRTLLATTTVRTHAGSSITKGGTPPGACPANSAAGALDAATHHRWGGTYSASVGGLEILSILGEKHSFSSPYFWEIFVNDRAASVGACQLKLHAGEQLLFAAVKQKGTAYPITIGAARTAIVGHPFPVKVEWFNAKGVTKPLAGATVSGYGHSGKTNRHGRTSLIPSHAGTFTIKATKAGFVRAAAVKVRVSG